MFFYSDKDGKNKSSALTPFSFIHFLSGIAFALVVYGVFNVSYINSFITYFVIHLLYELKDIYNSYNLNDYSYIHDNSLLNSIFDQICGVIGFIVGVWLWDTFKLDKLHAIIFSISYIFLFTYGRMEKIG